MRVSNLLEREDEPFIALSTRMVKVILLRKRNQKLNEFADVRQFFTDSLSWAGTDGAVFGSIWATSSWAVVGRTNVSVFGVLSNTLFE